MSAMLSSLDQLGGREENFVDLWTVDHRALVRRMHVSSRDDPVVVKVVRAPFPLAFMPANTLMSVEIVHNGTVF